MEQFTSPTTHIDSDNPLIIAFADKFTSGVTSRKNVAIGLYLAVRDGISYDPYRIDHTPGGSRRAGASKRDMDSA